LRWWGLLAGLAIGVVDTATMAALGVRIATWRGVDASLAVAGYFSVTFGLLGFLLGYAIEGRRRDRCAAAVIQAQTEAIAAVRARLVQGEKLAALGQLATAIAHEVRNPLAVIRSAAQGIGETLPPAPDGTVRACSFITAEIDRLSGVIGALLAFARPLRIHCRPVPVHELVDRALELASDDLAARQIRVRRAAAADLPPVAADADLICQVLLGLLANAAEAVPPGGSVTVEARPVGGGVELAVADSGPGVPVELRARIFEPFFTTRPHGTGLGLAVARQIVEAHGGRIDVAEGVGGGARFAVRLPVAA
jgi:two-component system sensor histidine kinase HydH